MYVYNTVKNNTTLVKTNTIFIIYTINDVEI